MMVDIREGTSIDKVDDLMDAIRDEFDEADAISNALAQPIESLLNDDDDLITELEEMMEADNVEEQLLEPSNTMEEIALPGVPNTELPEFPGATKAEEDELKQLLA